MSVTKHQLSNKWTVWFHKLYDDNWTINSYIELYTFDTIEEFWSVFNSLIPYMKNGILFIMKNGIKPIWEDPINIEGCTESFVSDKINHVEQWRELCMGLISNNLLTTDENILNGISCCPKKKGYLFKLWLKNCKDFKLNKEYDIDLSRSQKKIHKENII